MFDIVRVQRIDEARGNFKATHPQITPILCNLWMACYNPFMPIYEYECKKCKAHVEAFQKVSDKPLTKCRTCGGKLERKISAPAIQFKGSGWYVTDYAKKGGPASEAKDAAPKGDSSSTEPSTPAAAKTKSESSKKSSDSKD